MSARRVPVNAVALLAGRVLGAGVTLFVVAFSAHRLDSAAFGIVVSTMAAGFLANSLVTFGTDTVVTRAVAADRDDAAQVAVASLKLQLVVATALVLAALAAVLLGANIAILVQALALIPMAAVTVGGALLRGRQRMDQLLVASASGALAIVIALVVLLAQYLDAWVPIASLGIGATVTAAVLAAYAGSTTSSQGGGSIAIRALAIETAPFAGMVVLAAVGAQAGPLLVEFASDESAGGYGVAVRLAEAGRLVPAAAMGAFFPAMLSGLHRTERYAQWMRWLVVYALAATAAVLLLAEPINRIVFDEQPGGATLTRILALGLVITVARLALSFQLIARGHERTVLRGALGGALVTVVGGLVVAPRFGATGIAWAQIAGLVAATLLLVGRRSSVAEPSPLPTVGVGEVDIGDRHI